MFVFSSVFSSSPAGDGGRSVRSVRSVASLRFAVVLTIALAVALAVVLAFSVAFSAAVWVNTPSAWAAEKKESSGDGKALYKSAVQKVKKAHYAAAIEDLKKALKQNGKNADFWSLYGFAARKAGSYELAEKAYARALAINPNHLAALEYSGELYVETQRIEEARKHLERLVRLCPQGCRERTLLEQALEGQANDSTHKW